MPGQHKCRRCWNTGTAATDSWYYNICPLPTMILNNVNRTKNDTSISMKNIQKHGFCCKTKAVFVLSWCWVAAPVWRFDNGHINWARAGYVFCRILCVLLQLFHHIFYHCCHLSLSGRDSLHYIVSSKDSLHSLKIFSRHSTVNLWTWRKSLVTVTVMSQSISPSYYPTIPILPWQWRSW